MGKLIAAINMTLDGICDHTAGLPDDELHKHYSELLRGADCILYGRITYQLMEYWRGILKNPTGNKAMDEFARVMDEIPKLVFSHSLKALDWDSASLAKRSLGEEVVALKGQTGKTILVGSPGLIIALMRLDLIDELQICIQPVLAGEGMTLFGKLEDRILLELTATKTFGGGGVILYYTPKTRAERVWNS